MTFEKSKSWKCLKKNKAVELSTCNEESEKDINPEKISIALVYYLLYASCNGGLRN